MGEDTITVLLILLLAAAVVSLLGLLERRRYLALMRSRIAQEYGKLQTRELPPERRECVSAYFRKHGGAAAIDDVTWSDLELDRIFETMNVTYSAAGEELLYHTLRTPLYEEAALLERAEQIRFFQEHPEERERLQLIFAQIRKDDRYSLYDYLEFAENLKSERSLPYHAIAPALVVAAAALILVYPPLGVTALIAVVVLNMSWYFRTKRQIQPYMTTLKVILRDLRAAERIQGLALPHGQIWQEQLAGDLAALRRLRGGAGIVFAGENSDGNPLSLLGDYLNMLLHIDIIRFYQMYRQLQAHTAEIDAVHAAIGYLETLIALGSYRAALGDAVCTPVFDGREAARGIYHPLIAEPVRNDYELERNMLLTGSNASGKSTLLKTVAINQLFAQTLYLACAEEFHTSFHRIYTSMALRDDLAHSESYFMVELRAMRRILEAAGTEGAPISCFVDEVLRGTNTVERIAASTQILRYMQKNGILCYAATHDIELTELLAEEYENYHFEEEIRDGDVIFNYRLQAGRATTRNAIRLLSVMGYEDSIIEEAEEMAAGFLREGRWQSKGGQDDA